MKLSLLPAALLLALSLLCLPRARAATLGKPAQGETTLANYADGPQDSDLQFLNVDRLRAAIQPNEFFNWHALFEAIKRKLYFLNWDAFPKSP
ncbi:keratinocyte differentiation-associated protein isoform X2 [Ornithorhynchus anatinus]|uniref:keratinocyte differentiation-associated protein isoform X2 n=1 Tax=Ornithorhynchus anatinus TaxID=9258 RepID=UPI0010A8D10B|nr:keratinocyte differentiation-associated protein isoform X2 [Ornithorhynchus anatinus]